MVQYPRPDLNLNVRAQVIDIRKHRPTQGHCFFVDTNVWGYYFDDIFKPGRELENYKKNYINYIDEVIFSRAKLQYSCTVGAELFGLVENRLLGIENTLRRKKYHSNKSKTDKFKKIEKKEYRHNRTDGDREEYLELVRAILDGVKKLASDFLEVKLNKAALKIISEVMGNAEIDSSDALIVATMKTNGVTDIITNDMDFATVDGIRVFTANGAAINCAREQDKLSRG